MGTAEPARAELAPTLAASASTTAAEERLCRAQLRLTAAPAAPGRFPRAAPSPGEAGGRQEVTRALLITSISVDVSAEQVQPRGC